MWFWAFWVLFCIVVILLFYVRWLLKSLAVINEDVQQLTLIVSDFSSHIESIHELEMFYGDTQLKSLLDHSKLVAETIQSIDLLLVDQEQELDEETEKKTN